MTIAETTYRQYNLRRGLDQDQDQDLEALIDEAGRAEVFALAAANGWNTGTAPPKWVWRQFCVESKRQTPPHDAI